MNTKVGNRIDHNTLSGTDHGVAAGIVSFIDGTPVRICCNHCDEPYRIVQETEDKISVIIHVNPHVCGVSK